MALQAEVPGRGGVVASAQHAALSEAAAAPKLSARPKGRWYLGILWLAMASGGFVVVEPAPTDLLMILLLLLGSFASYISVSSRLVIPLGLLWLFLLGNLTGMFRVLDAPRSIFYLSVTLYLIFAWVVVASAVSRFQVRGLRSLFSGYVLAAAAAAALGSLAFLGFLPGEDILLKYGRATGLFKDPNVFGPFLIPVSLYALARLETGPGSPAPLCGKFWRSIGWLGVFGITTLGVLLSFSRAAWGNYLVAVSAYAGLRLLTAPGLKAMIGRLARYLTVVVILALGLRIALDTPQIGPLFTHRLGLQGYDSDRFATQASALDTAVEHPFGVGPGQSEIVFQYATHSLYARVLAENGVLGFLAFTSFLGATLIRALRLAFVRDQRLQVYLLILAPSLLGLLVNSLVIDSLHWRHFWVLLALPWASYGKVRSPAK